MRVLLGKMMAGRVHVDSHSMIPGSWARQPRATYLAGCRSVRVGRSERATSATGSSQTRKRSLSRIGLISDSEAWRVKYGLNLVVFGVNEKAEVKVMEPSNMDWWLGAHEGFVQAVRNAGD
jgi:hypothetical protein